MHPIIATKKNVFANGKVGFRTFPPQRAAPSSPLQSSCTGCMPFLAYGRSNCGTRSCALPSSCLITLHDKLLHT